MLGLYLRSILPDHHLSPESREVVKLGMGLIGTMTALLLGMQLGNAKETYDGVDAKIKDMAAKLSFLDRLMATYGPESKEARESLRSIVARGVDHLFPKDGVIASMPAPSADGGESWYHQIQALTPDTPAKAALKAEAVSLATEIGRIRWLMFAQSRGSGSLVFITMVVLWLAVVFISFGLLGTPNATVIVTLLVCAMSVSAAIGLIMELSRPLSGMIRISSEPLRQVLNMMGT